MTYFGPLFFFPHWYFCTAFVDWTVVKTCKSFEPFWFSFFFSLARKRMYILKSCFNCLTLYQYNFIFSYTNETFALSKSFEFSWEKNLEEGNIEKTRISHLFGKSLCLLTVKKDWRKKGSKQQKELLQTECQWHFRQISIISIWWILCWASGLSQLLKVSIFMLSFHCCIYNNNLKLHLPWGSLICFVE